MRHSGCLSFFSRSPSRLLSISPHVSLYCESPACTASLGSLNCELVIPTESALAGRHRPLEARSFYPGIEEVAKLLRRHRPVRVLLLDAVRTASHIVSLPLPLRGAAHLSKKADAA